MQLFRPTENGYQPTPLREPMRLGLDGILAAANHGRGDLPGVWIIPARGAGGIKRAVLLTNGCDVLVNGRAPLPMTELRRGDEVRVGRTSIYYTDEDALEVIPFDPLKFGNQATRCGRCHRELREGEPVCACPQCGMLYMAQPDQDPNCFAFGPCLSCKRDPNVEFVWQPENFSRVGGVANTFLTQRREGTKERKEGN